MEENQDSSLFGTEIDSTGQGYLSSISKWTKFIAITGIVAVGLFLLIVVGYGKSLIYEINTLLLGSSSMLGLMIGIFIFCLALVIAWLYFLLRTASLLRKSLNSRNTDELAEAFKSLRNFFVISIVFSLLSMLSSVVGLIK